MNIGHSKSIWGHGGRFDGEEVSSPLPWGGGGSSIKKNLQILDLQRLASLQLLNLDLLCMGLRDAFLKQASCLSQTIIFPPLTIKSGDIVHVPNCCSCFQLHPYICC